MVGYIEESKGGDFRPTPEGVHLMVCTRVIDLGTQKTEFNGEVKHQRKVLISWEIPGERIQVDGRDVPVLHSEKFTWSFHEKANLRKVLEAWRGKKFVDADFAGPPNGFHIKNLLGVPCNGQVMHETGNNGRIYANLSSVMKYTAPREHWPQAEGELIFFDLDAPDRDLFSKLPKYWQGLIAESPEGRAAGLEAPRDDQSRAPAGMSGSHRAAYDAQAPDPRDADFDPIPF